MSMNKILLVAGLTLAISGGGCVTREGEVVAYPKLTWETDFVDSRVRHVTNTDTGDVGYYVYDGAGRYRCVSTCNGFPRFLAADAAGGAPAEKSTVPEREDGDDHY